MSSIRNRRNQIFNNLISSIGNEAMRGVEFPHLTRFFRHEVKNCLEKIKYINARLIIKIFPNSYEVIYIVHVTNILET